MLLKIVRRLRQAIYDLGLMVRVYAFTFNKRLSAADKTGKGPVMIMVYSINRGGAERVAVNLASGFAEDRRVFLVCIEPREDEYPVPPGVTVVYLLRWTSNEHGFKTCIKWLKRFGRVKVSISLMYTMNRLNVLTRGKERVICSERNDIRRREPERFDEISELYAAADSIVFQSETIRDLFDERIRARSAVLPNPVWVEQARLPESRPRIVSIGRLHPQKNQALLLRSFAAFSRQHPAYTLTIYGKGELLDDLSALAKKLGIEEKVFLPGNIPDVHRQIADAEMFVLSSDYEGLSNALLECMTMGFPCISTACAGSVDVIEDGRNGLLVEIGNEEQLTRAMCRLADDPALRERLGEQAARTLERYSARNVVREWMELADQE